MTEDFYTKNLVNTNTNTSYDDFLESIKKQLNSPENIASIDAKNNQISNILPSYSIPAIDFG
jgi:chloramphenicol O-acetyltransferase